MGGARGLHGLAGHLHGTRPQQCLHDAFVRLIGF
jgi:hypothetical protein